MIELRSGISGKYKGLIFCNSIEESENIIKELKIILFRNFNKELNEIKVIFLSAKNKISDIELGLQLGADKYISKPFSTKKLVKEVKELLK